MNTSILSTMAEMVYSDIIVKSRETNKDLLISNNKNVGNLVLSSTVLNMLTEDAVKNILIEYFYIIHFSHDSLTNRYSFTCVSKLFKEDPDLEILIDANKNFSGIIQRHDVDEYKQINEYTLLFYDDSQELPVFLGVHEYN